MRSPWDGNVARLQRMGPWPAIQPSQLDHGWDERGSTDDHRRAHLGSTEGAASVSTPVAGQVDFVDPLDLVDAERYALRGYPHDVWTRLRAEAPVAWIQPPGFEPFWAITKRADIQHIAAAPLLFSSAYGISLRKAGPPLPAVPPHTEILVAMDPPRHGPLRRVAIPAFRPRSLRARRSDIDAIAVELLDEALTDGTEIDFVERVAAPFPLAVIAVTLGVPRSDVDLL